MSMGKETSKAAKAFAAELNDLARKQSEAERRYREEVENVTLRHLEAEFPDYAFDPTHLHLESKSYRCMAKYQDNNRESFSVNPNGEIEREATHFGKDCDRALHQAEGEYTVALVMERTGRECKVQIYFKNSGDRDLSTGYMYKTRLVHEDSYGGEYIVVNEENCYLENLRKDEK